MKRSKKLENFIKEITYQNRNPAESEANDVLDLLKDDKSNPIEIVQSGVQLYRCRKLRQDVEIHGIDPFNGLSEQDSFIPPVEKTFSARANYRFIPYLYVATSGETAIREVRPSLMNRVNVATIEVRDHLKLLDLTLKHAPVRRIKDAKRNLLVNLSELFSKPVDNTDEPEEYIPTQFIAEYVKKQGYDGIKYKSSLGESKGDNIVVFSYDKCKVVGTVIVRVTNITIS